MMIASARDELTITVKHDNRDQIRCARDAPQTFHLILMVNSLHSVIANLVSLLSLVLFHTFARAIMVKI